MTADHVDSESDERFRDLLLMLARAQIGPKYRSKIDPEDAVNQTLFDAHRQRAQFQGSSDDQRIAWLKRMLGDNVKDAIKFQHREKRDIDREAGPAVLVVEHPEFADEIREFLADQEQLHDIAVPLANPVIARRPVLETIRYFGDYELLEEIARGGMGVVYKARQNSLNRIVAVKMILSGTLASETDSKRFQAEAESAASLKHPNIVAVHEVGRHNGQSYFSMDFINGKNLSEIVREKPLVAKTAAQHVLQIAEAIHFAHQQGTLHRDLKPSNVLIDANGDVQITDFGLALRVEGDSELTRTGQVLGTPSYMPPEQAQNKRGLVGPCSDVYSLGAILYELLTGRPPFRAESAVETLRQVMETEPLSPRLLNPNVPRDMETICLKCLQKEPHNRYATAQHLADDLRRYLDGEPILARPISRPARLWRWCRRKPAVAGASSLALLFLVAGILGVSYFAISAEMRRNEAEDLVDEKAELAAKNSALAESQTKLREKAEDREQAALLHLYYARVSAIAGAWESRDLARLERLLERSTPADGEPDFRGWEWYYYRKLARLGGTRLTHGQRYTDVAAWHPGANLVAVRNNKNEIEIWEMARRRIVAALPQNNLICDLAWHPDGKRLAIADAHEVRVVEIATKSPQQTIRWPGATALFIAWSPDGRRLAVAGRDRTHFGVIRIYEEDSTSPKCIFRDSSSFRNVTGIAWHPTDHKTLLSTHLWGVMNLWDCDLKSRTRGLSPPKKYSLGSAPAWSVNGERFAVASRDLLRIFDRTGQFIREFAMPSHVRTITWSEDNDSIFVGTMLGEIAAVSVDSGELNWVFGVADGPVGGIYTLGDALVIVGDVVRVIRRGALNNLNSQSTPLVTISDLAVSPDGSSVAVGGLNGVNKCFVIDRASMAVRAILELQNTEGISVDWAPDGEKIAVQTYLPRGVEIYRVAGAERLKVLPCLGRSESKYVKWSPTGEWLAYCDDDASGTKPRRLEIWNTQTWEKDFETAFDGATIGWSRNGRYLAAGNLVLKTGSWETVERLTVADANGQSEGFLSAPYEPLIGHSRRNLSRLLPSARVDAAFSKPAALFSKIVDCSPDGTRVIGVWKNASIGVWEAASGTLLTTIPTGKEIRRLKWFPDGMAFAVGFVDGSVDIMTADDSFARPAALRLFDAIDARPKDQKISESEWAENSPLTRLFALNRQDRSSLTSGAFVAAFERIHQRVSVDEFFPGPEKTKSAGNTIRVIPALESRWALQSIRSVPSFLSKRTEGYAAAFSPDGRWIASIGRDRSVFICDATTGKKLHSLPVSPVGTYDVQFSPDGRLLATAGYDAIRLWDLKSGKPIRVFHEARSRYTARVRFSPNGRRIAGAHSQGVTIWDVETGKRLRGLNSKGRVRSSAAVFSPDGRFLATSRLDGIAKVWNAETGEELFSLKQPFGHYSVAFSPDGNRLATVSKHRITVWDWRQNKTICEIPGGLHTVEFSANGKWLLAPQIGNEVVLWDATTGEKLFGFLAHRRKVFSAAFSTDGRRIVTSSNDGTVKIWEVPKQFQAAPVVDRAVAISNNSATLKVRPGDWPQWGGSRMRNNTPEGKNIPTNWNIETGLNIKWKARLGTQTYGNPSVANGKVFIGTNNGAGYLKRFPRTTDLGVLLCFEEKTGKFLWQYSSQKLKSGRVHDWPEQGMPCTPVVDGKRLWAVTNRCEVVCLDTEGFRDGKNDGPYRSEPNQNRDEADVLWKFDMMARLGVSPHNMSHCSMIIADRQLFVCTSNGVDASHVNLPAPDAPSFLCLDRDTGKVLWTDKSPGKNILHGQWASPSYAVLGGRPQVLFPGGDGWLYSFDPRGDGRGKSKLLWKFDTNPKSARWILGGRGTRNNLVGFACIHEGRVYIANGQDPEHGEGMGLLWCINPTKKLDGSDVSPELAVDVRGRPLPHRRLRAVNPKAGEKAIPNPNSAVIWHYGAKSLEDYRKQKFEQLFHRTIGTPAIKNGLLFIADFSGLLHCLDAKTGKPHWTYDLFAACWGSPLIVDGKVYIGDEDGDIAIFPLTADPRKALVKATDNSPWPALGEINMGTAIYPTPIVANNVLYIANKNMLYAIQGLASNTPRSPADMERDQLIEELALRSALIDAEALRAAKESWQQESEVPFSEYLVSCALLDSAERDALASLADSHLRRRQSGSHQSFEAQSAIGTVISGPDSSTILDNQPPAGPSDVLKHTSGQTSSISGRFEVIREYARGGLGVVSLAIDNELNREVVLKEIRSEHSVGGESQRRFLAEAEITGGLEHPGVVPVYSLGRDASNRPFYAMRFIRGENLGEVAARFHSRESVPAPATSPGRQQDDKSSASEARPQISRRNVEFRKLCGRFVDVCNVIEYAHNRGVVHRDLKPDNIMLGDYGETIVVDWGLAKPIGQRSESRSSDGLPPLHSKAADEVAASMAGQIVGTPAFMSPEQALGWVDKVGPATDVYCLGATLYFVLTGRAPFVVTDSAEDGIEGLLARVVEGRVDPPETLNRSVPRALSAICMKAMSVKASDRYRSARELADDVDNWLADEPVTAYSEPLTERLRRWSRRHRTLTTGVAVLLVTSVVGLSVGLGAVKREQSRTEERRIEAVAAQKEADRQAGLATESAKHARSQNRLALDTLDSVVFDIQQSLKTVPGTDSVRRHLLGTVITNLGKVARGLETAPQADRDLAVAYIELGDVFLRIGSEPGLSATEEAEKLYRRSATILAKLQKAGTEDPRVVFDHATAWINIGDVTVQRGKLNPASDHYQNAFDIVSNSELTRKETQEKRKHLSVIYERLGNVAREKGDLKTAEKYYSDKLKIEQQAIESGSTDNEQLRGLAITYDRFALLHLRRGRLTDAETAYRKALDLRRKVAVARPNDRIATRDYIVSQLNVGDVLESKGEFREARQIFETALRQARKLLDSAPDDRELLRDVSNLCERVGDVCKKLNDDESARKHFAEKFAIDRKLAGADTGDARAQRDLSLALERLGDEALEADQFDEALKHFRKKLTINQKLSLADPDNVDDRRNLSIAHSKLGAAEQRSGDLAAAVKSIEKAYAIGEELIRKSPQDKKLQQDFSYFCGQLAAIRLRTGEYGDARRLYIQKRDIDLKLVADDPENAKAQSQLAIACDGLGEIAERANDHKQAREHHQKALAIRRTLAGNVSQNIETEPTRELMVSLRNVGSASFLLKDTRMAHRYFKEGFDIAAKRHAARPDDTKRQNDFSNFCQSMGDVLLRMGNVDEALKHYQKKLELDRALAAAYPRSINYQRNLAIALDRLADYHFRRRDWRQSERFYLDCLKQREELLSKSPGNVQLLSDVMVSYAKLGNFDNNRYHYAEAVKWWKKALNVITRLSDAARQQPIMQARQKLFQQRLGTNQLIARCVNDLQFTLAQPARHVPELLRARGCALAVAGKTAEAERTAETLAGRDSEKGKCRYLAARIYAQCAAAILRETKKGTELSAEQKKRLATFSDRAVALLKEAEQLKFFDTPAVAAAQLSVWDFDSVRSHEQFMALRQRTGMTGRKIGPFLLRDKLGVGGMGIVYRATYEKTGQDVALKVLSPQMSADKQVTKRFVREMDILKRLEHKNIVKYHGGGTDGDQFYYAMEIVDGGSLDDYLKRKERLSWEQTIEVAKAVARGLEHAHNKGIIHRDLKPANLFLTKTGKIKLGDFGIARDTERTALTAAGKTVGTYAYMAPEQIAGKPPVSRKTDLYALGCVMFQMLSGRVPFEAENAAEMLMQHLEMKPPRVSEFCPDCPLWLEQVISKLLAKEPDDRYYDARALHSALNDVGRKVAEHASISKQTVEGDVTVLATRKDDKELKKLLGRKRKKKKNKSAPFYEKAWFLGVCLATLIGVIVWAMWPLSDEEKFNRGKQLMVEASELPEDDADRVAKMIDARDKYFEPLLESSPDGEYAEQARAYLMTIKVDSVDRRVENRIKRGIEPKSAAERSYITARKAQIGGDRITAIDRYRSMIVLLTGREEDEPYVILAKRRIDEIRRKGSDDNVGREIILEGLKRAERYLEDGKTIDADSVYSAIIKEYDGNLELAPLVQKARDARNQLAEKKKD
eukprot:g21888.t1